MAAIEANPTSSLQDVGDQIGKSHSQVICRLHHHGFKSYRTAVHQELRPGDAERRLEFARSALKILDDDPHFTQNIVFTDESTFKLHHRPNIQDHRIWAQVNPRRVYPGSTQYPQSLNV